MAEIKFNILKRRPFHLLRNATNPNELIFIIDTLKPKIKKGKNSFSYKELVIDILLEEFRKKKFQEFHSQTWKTFSGMNPDIENRLNKMKRITSSFIEKVLVKDHTNKKTFLNIWTELLRDCIDFWAYTGVLPSYYKGTRSVESENAHLVTEPLVEYVNLRSKKSKTNFFAQSLMNFKIRNSCLDFKTYNSLNRKLRPFYVTLKILIKLKEEGIEGIPQRTLAYAVSTIFDEGEIFEVVKELVLLNDLDESGEFNINYLKSMDLIPEVYIKEAGRASSVLIPNLKYANLIVGTKKGRLNFFRITDQGIAIYEKTPPNSIYFSESILESSPFVGAVLNCFTKTSFGNESIIPIENLREHLKISLEILNQILESIKTELIPNPIKKISKGLIYLNSKKFQYHINPFSDFASVREAKIAKGHIFDIESFDFNITEHLPKEMLNELYIAGQSSDGERFEKSIHQILKEFPYSYLKWYGTQHVGKKLPDFLWVPKIKDPKTTLEVRPIIIVIEAKAGNAILQFRDEIAIPEINNALSSLKRKDLIKSAGVWYWLISGRDKLPSKGSHGGHRGVQLKKSLPQKLFELVRTSDKQFFATCFTTKTWSCYIAYLYSLIRSYDLKVISPNNIPHFWNWSPNYVFTNEIGAPISLYSDPSSFCINFDYN